MKKHLLLALTILAGTLAIPARTQPFEHERLRIRNTFRTPEEVVRYYCARDASGFVWSGLLDAERAAFTLWHEAPQQDSFYIAKKYEVLAGHPADAKKDQATVDVKYELLAVGDAHGTRTPPPRAEYHVVFNLKKIAGAWKIVKPDASEIAPVVLEAKFPTLTGSSAN